jgi:hypothetical protein
MYYFVTTERQGFRSLQERVRRADVLSSHYVRSKSIAMQWFPSRERLIEEAQRFREEAAKIPDGMARLLLQEAFRAETAVIIDRFLSSPQWQRPE